MLQNIIKTIITTPSFIEKNSAKLKVEHTRSKKDERTDCKSPLGVSKLSELENYQLARDREIRVKMVPRRYGIVDLISYALAAADKVNREEPVKYKEAMSSKDKCKWLAAMKEEITSLKKNNTWILVKRPPNKKLIACKWIYKLKRRSP